jgi:hypothetical protein
MTTSPVGEWNYISVKLCVRVIAGTFSFVGNFRIPSASFNPRQHPFSWVSTPIFGNYSSGIDDLSIYSLTIATAPKAIVND